MGKAENLSLLPGSNEGDEETLGKADNLFLLPGTGKGNKEKRLGKAAHLEEALLPVQELIKVQVSTQAAILGWCMSGPLGTPGGPLHICQLGQGASLASAD